MGNTICTDSLPFEIEDIATTDDLYPGVPILQNRSLLPSSVADLYQPYNHNLKAFRFHFSSRSNGNQEESAGTFSSSMRVNEDGGAASSSRMGLGAAEAAFISEIRGASPAFLSRIQGQNGSTNKIINSAADEVARDDCDGLGHASSDVRMEAVNLSQEILVKTTDIYLVIHIQRAGANSSGNSLRHSIQNISGTASSSRQHYRSQRDADAEHYGEDRAPYWARGMNEVFTPRGLATSFSNDIGKPVWRGTSLFSTPRGYQDEFQYSLHLLTGKRSDSALAAKAVIQSLQIERRLKESDELLRRLFFNCNLNRIEQRVALSATTLSRKQMNVMRPVLIGNIAFESVSAASPNASVTQENTYSFASVLRLNDAYNRNALLRYLHQQKLSPRPPIISMPAWANQLSSPRFSYSGTPRAYNFSPSATTSVANAQGKPGLEVPRLKIGSAAAPNFSANAPLFHTGTYSARSDGGGRPALSPHDALLQVLSRQISAPQSAKDSAQVDAAVSETCSSRASYTFRLQGVSPNASSRLPVISTLRIDDALQHRARQAYQASAQSTTDIENDERKASEERLNRFTAAVPEVTEVLPWLFVGGEVAAQDRTQLLEKGITSIVNTVSFSLPNYHSDLFRYLSLNLSDSPDDPIYSLFPLVNRFIEESYLAGGKVFIHCHQGVSRSCSLVIAYVMWKKGMCYDRAFELVRSCRKICNPNAGFYVNLLLWESHLSKPSINKAYAYVPYSREYPFPLSFRVTFSFRGRSIPNYCDELQVVNKDLEVLTDKASTYKLDPRLCYGFIFGESGNASITSPSSNSSRKQKMVTCFLPSKMIDSAATERAKGEWRSFINYHFYIGPRIISKNNKNESIEFKPIVLNLLQNIMTLGSVDDLQELIPDSIFGGGRLNPKALHVKDNRWDSLLSSNCMKIPTFPYSEEEVESSFQNTAALWKARQDELARTVSKSSRPHFQIRSRITNNSTEHASTYRTSAIRIPATSRTESKRPYLFMTTRAQTNGLTALDSGRTEAITVSTTNAAASLPYPFRLPSPPPPITATTPTTSAAGELEDTNEDHSCANLDLEVLIYPFQNPPCTDIMTIDDLSSDKCYAVVVPNTMENSSLCHKIFVWIGRNCHLSSEEIQSAFQSRVILNPSTLNSSKSHKGHSMTHSKNSTCAWRLSNGTLLHNAKEEIVYEGSEPDEMLLALD